MNVPAEHVLHLPGVASVSWIAVLEREDMRREIGGNVLAVRHASPAVLVTVDFDRIVAVSDGALVERTLDAHVGLSLPGLLQSVGHARSEEIPYDARNTGTVNKRQEAKRDARRRTLRRSEHLGVGCRVRVAPLLSLTIDAFSGKIAAVRRIRKAHSVWL
jgi:hypothetical protein